MPNLLTYLGVASLLGVAGSLLLARRVKRQTLGLEPKAITRLAEHRDTMLHGIKEGVVGLDPQHRVTLVNDEAMRLLDLPADSVGRTLTDLGVDRRLYDVLSGQTEGQDQIVLLGERVLILNRVPVSSRGRAIGSVTTLRDRTELVSLQRELDVTRTTTDTLRAQAHEFSNQLHTISGLIELEEYHEVVRYVSRLTRSQARLNDKVTSHIEDPSVAALLIAKASQAGEQGVQLRISDGTRLGRVDELLSADLTTVVGNLVDNALDAIGYAPDGWVAVEIAQENGHRAGDGPRLRARGGAGAGRGGLRARVHHQGGRRRPARDRPGAHPDGLRPARRSGECPQRRRRRVHRRAARSHRGGAMISTLVVDDDFMVAKIHAAFVGRTPGFEVVRVVHTGADALRAAHELHPDLVLLDIYLPDRNGVEVLERLRAETPDVDVLGDHRGPRGRHRSPGALGRCRQLPDQAVRIRRPAGAPRALRRRPSPPRRGDRGRPVGCRPGVRGQGPVEAAAQGLSSETAELVRNVLCEAPSDLSASECAALAGLSRISARRYLEFFAETGRVKVRLRYGAAGRPERRYRWRTS